MAEDRKNGSAEPAAPVEPAVTPQRKRKWPRFLLVWALVLLIAGLLGCFLLFQYLGIYEVTRPEGLMDDLMVLMSAEDWLNRAAQNPDFELTEFEDVQTLYAEYRGALSTDQELSYRSDKSESDAEHAVFVVRCGAVNLCRVELVNGGRRLPFGRHNWTLGRVSTGDITKGLRSASVEITALSNQEITLNGMPVGEKYLVDKAVEIQDLSEIERRMDEVPMLQRYRIGPLYGEIHVCADERELTPEESGKKLLYTAVTEGTGTLTIRAPEDIRITVGGAELKRKDADERSIGLLEGLEKYAGDELYYTNTYRFEGLYTTPEVLAFDAEGRELRPIMSGESEYNFFHPTDTPADEDDEKTLAHLQELAEGYFNSFVDYTTKPFDSALYYKLLTSTLAGSPLQAYIAQSTATMKWAAQTDTERTLRVDNVHRIGDSLYTCTVEFEVDKTASTWVEEVSSTEANAEEMIFVRHEKYWYAAALSMIGD